jgi:hypothetical protein
MTVIVDFKAYQSSRLLGAFARQAGEVVRLLDAQRYQINQLGDEWKKLCESVCAFGFSIEHCRQRLDQTLAISRECQNAEDSGDIDQMLSARDLVLRETKKRWRLH